MAKGKKAKLGRGLDALLGDSSASALDKSSSSKGAEQAVGGDVFKTLPVEFMQRGKYQPRNLMDEEALQELAASISTQGIVQPILVRELKKDSYEIVAGERRWRAAQLAGLEQVPVIVRQIEDEAAVAVALIENIQRENLSALEESRGIARLLEEFGLTHQQAADSIGRSRTAVTNLLRLLSLSPAVQDLLEQKQFEMGHARALLAVPEAEQLMVAKKIIGEKMSVRQAEQWIKRHLEHDLPTPKSSGGNADIMRLQDKLSESLGAQVQLQDRNGKGKLVISYHSLAQLDGIIEQITE